MVRGRSTYVWNAERNDFLRRNAGLMKDKELATVMSKHFAYYFSISAIRLQRRALGIKKRGGRGKYEIKSNK